MSDTSSHFSYLDIYEMVKEMNLFYLALDLKEFPDKKYIFHSNRIESITKLKLTQALVAMYPIEVTSCISASNFSGCATDMQNGKFVRRGNNKLHVAKEDVYNDIWKKGIKDGSLLYKIKKHWEDIIQYTVRTRIYYEINPDKTMKTLTKNDIDNPFIVGRKERIEENRENIEKELKAKLKESLSEIKQDQHYGGNSNKRLEALIEDSPIAAICALSSLSLLETGDEDEEAMINIVFDFFSGKETHIEQLYFEYLWKTHCKGNSKGKIKSKKNKDLVDYYSIPKILDKENNLQDAPFDFSGSNKVKHVTSGSGFGKTTLLEVLLLCSILERLIEWDSEIIKGYDDKKIKRYRQIKTGLLGEDPPEFFPVFIHSSKANDRIHPILNKDNLLEKQSVVDYKTITELADNGGIVGFNEAFQTALNENRVLLLIDSIDEVEGDKIKEYLKTIEQAVSEDYSQSAVVQASRPLRIKIKYDCDLLKIHELQDEEIGKIASAISEDYPQRLNQMFERNPILFKLAHNPFMLFKMIDNITHDDYHFIILEIIRAIIDTRWDNHSYDIDTDKVILLLGYLALRILFVQKTNVSMDDIKVFFENAINDFNDWRVSLEVSKENIDILLRVLSSQSGILIIDEASSIERYKFQESDIMCWMAAFCFQEIVGTKKEGITDSPDEEVSIENILWIRKTIKKLSDGNQPPLSCDAIKMLLICISLLNGKTSYIQKDVFRFLWNRMGSSDDKEELECLCAGLEMLKDEESISNGISLSLSMRR